MACQELEVKALRGHEEFIDRIVMMRGVGRDEAEGMASEVSKLVIAHLLSDGDAKLWYYTWASRGSSHGDCMKALHGLCAAQRDDISLPLYIMHDALKMGQFFQLL